MFLNSLRLRRQQCRRWCYQDLVCAAVRTARMRRPRAARRWWVWASNISPPPWAECCDDSDAILLQSRHDIEIRNCAEIHVSTGKRMYGMGVPELTGEVCVICRSAFCSASSNTTSRHGNGLFLGDSFSRYFLYINFESSSCNTKHHEWKIKMVDCVCSLLCSFCSLLVSRTSVVSWRMSLDTFPAPDTVG